MRPAETEQNDIVCALVRFFLSQILVLFTNEELKELSFREWLGAVHLIFRFSINV